MKKIIFFLSVLACISFNSEVKAFVVFEESFDGVDLPINWNFDTDGEWAIVNNELAQLKTIATPGHADAWAGDLTWTDYSVEMKFKFFEFGTDSMDAGLGLRHDSSYTGGNFFVTRVSWRDNYWSLEVVKTLSPEIHLPLNQNLTTNIWYTMKSQIEGDHLKVWVNNVFYDFGDISSSTYPIPSAGGIGVWANKAHVHYDDIIVDNLQRAPIPEPATILLFGFGLFTLLRRRK